MVYLIKNNGFSSNSYLLSDDNEQNCLIIDPGLDEILIDNQLQELKLKPVAILATHGHFDHIAGVSYFKEKYNIPFYLHEADLKICQSVNFYLKIAQVNNKIITPVPDYLFKGENENVSILGFYVNVYNFPGHSNGSCIIKINKRLFSGDIIYKNSIGMESMPRENKTLLKESIIKIFEKFDDKDLIFPGHGQSEYLGNIKQYNLKLREFLNK